MSYVPETLPKDLLADAESGDRSHLFMEVLTDIDTVTNTAWSLGGQIQQLNQMSNLAQNGFGSSFASLGMMQGLGNQGGMFRR